MEKTGPINITFVTRSLDTQDSQISQFALHAKNTVLDYVIKKIILKTG